MNILTALYASRENGQTIFKTLTGQIKAIKPKEQRQPKRGQRTITLNCFKYALIWI